MSEHFQAVGWSPRPPEQQELWRSRLAQWLRRTVQSGEFNHRHPMQAWQGDGFEQKLWNFMAMGDVLQSKGYVGWLRMERSFAPRPGAARVTEEIIFWEAVRCLPETETELRSWNYTVSNPREVMVYLGYNRQYNATLRSRLTNGYMPTYAHRSAVQGMDDQGRQLLWRAVTEMVLAGAGASAPGAPHCAPGSGVGIIPGMYQHARQMGPPPG